MKSLTALVLVAAITLSATSACAKDPVGDDIKIRKFFPLAVLQQTRIAGKIRYRHDKRVERRDERR